MVLEIIIPPQSEILSNTPYYWLAEDIFVMNVKLYAGTLSMERVTLCKQKQAHTCLFCSVSPVIAPQSRSLSGVNRGIKQGIILIWHNLEQKHKHFKHPYAVSSTHRNHPIRPHFCSILSVQYFKFTLFHRALITNTIIVILCWKEMNHWAGYSCPHPAL